MSMTSGVFWPEGNQTSHSNTMSERLWLWARCFWRLAAYPTGAVPIPWENQTQVRQNETRLRLPP